MGKFDNYNDGKSPRFPAPNPASNSQLAESRTRHEGYIAKAKQAAASGTVLNRDTKGPAFAIALDATGSMASLIGDARRDITTILKRIYAEAQTTVRMRILVYRDYDVAQHLYECSPLTSEAQELEQWLGQIEVHGGGANEGEAIEAVLETVYNANETRALLLAGDEPSNPRSDLDRRGFGRKLTAHDWARRFSQRGVPIHTFAVGDDPRTFGDFQAIAQLAGGQAGRLDGSSAMIDMAVMAMLSSLKGTSSVRRYMEQYALTAGAKEFGKLLLAAPSKKENR